MHIKIYQWTNKYDRCRCQNLYIDGKDVRYVGRSEPEDAIIGRDLVSCVEIKDFMERAFNAAKNGEEFTVEVVKGDPDEDESI